MSQSSPVGYEDLRFLRLARRHCSEPFADFATHLYRSVLGRDPDFDPGQNSDTSPPKSKPYEHRCQFLRDVLVSRECALRHSANYPNFIASFLRALGSPPHDLLCAKVQAMFPAFENLVTHAPDLCDVIAHNSRRLDAVLGELASF